MDLSTARAEASRFGRRIIDKIWDTQPINDRNTNEPVWLLGSRYTLEANTEPQGGDKAPAPTHVELPATPPDSSSSCDSTLTSEDIRDDGNWPVAFLDDFASRIWMTYRAGFVPIQRSTDPDALRAMSFAMRLRALADQSASFSSDTGWGCMIRSGQSLLANALLACELGRDWRRSTSSFAERKILSQFADDPRAPFSIHSFVQHGAGACGKYPGEWFGPSATAICIKELTNAHRGRLRVYSTGTSPDVYEDSFLSIAKPEGEHFHPTLILVGTRLGIDKINAVYWEALAATLQLPQSVGIAGGRPSSSHYFIGSQRSTDEPGSYLYYLDPHHTRPALPYHENPENYSTEDVDTCHTRRLRRLHVRDMDPSMLIGFLIMDEDDWDSWKSSVKYVQGRSIINISDHNPAASERSGAIDEVETLSDDDDNETVLGS